MAAPILLSEITTPEKAAFLFTDRRTSDAIAASKFLAGDHFQDFAGWIGAKPQSGSKGYNELSSQIQEAFVSENVIKEVVDRHNAGILGREPLWGFIPGGLPPRSAEQRRKLFTKIFQVVRTTVQKATGTGLDKLGQEADDALTSWWNEQKIRKTLKRALETALVEDRVLLRYFFPVGAIARDDNGQIVQGLDLAAAVKVPHLMIVTQDKGGVFTDADTQQQFGVVSYKDNDDKQVVELTYVQDGVTFLKILTDQQQPQVFTFDLGGRLLMYELERPALITAQVMSCQRSLNLALTMMMRNVNLAGSLERTVMNAERPKEVKETKDAAEPSGVRRETKNSDYFTGPGATMFLTGVLIKNDDGVVIGRANPNISFRDPVAIDTFTGTRDQYYASILGQCQQRHALISGDAASSGKSREQARAEFRGSLMDSAEPVEDAGRWILETDLFLGAQLCGRSSEFLQLRCDFNARIEDGPIDADERAANRADVQAGLMSKETAMSRNGVEDTDAELERIAQEPQPRIDLTNQPQDQQPIA